MSVIGRRGDSRTRESTVVQSAAHSITFWYGILLQACLEQADSSCSKRVLLWLSLYVQGDTKKRELLNYHCFCKTFLWRKHAVDRSADPWLLNGEVVCSSRSLFRSAANCTGLPLRISKVPVFLCYPVQWSKKGRCRTNEMRGASSHLGPNWSSRHEHQQLDWRHIQAVHICTDRGTRNHFEILTTKLITRAEVNNEFQSFFRYKCVPKVYVTTVCCWEHNILSFELFKYNKIFFSSITLCGAIDTELFINVMKSCMLLLMPVRCNHCLNHTLIPLFPLTTRNKGQFKHTPSLFVDVPSTGMYSPQV